MLATFLKERVVNKGEPFTVSSREPAKAYFVDDHDYKNFLNYYQSSISKGIITLLKANKVPTFMEKPSDHSPYRVDNDFKCKLDAGLDRQYDEELVKEVIKVHQEQIRKIIHPDVFEDRHLFCVLLEKSTPREDEGFIKDGFHLHFPHFLCDSWTMDDYLRSRTRDVFLDQSTYDNIKFLAEPANKRNISSVDIIIDSYISKKPWHIYGSAKSSRSEPYQISKIYDNERNEIDLTDCFPEYADNGLDIYNNIPSALSVRDNGVRIRLKEVIEKKRMEVVHRKRKPAVMRKKNDEDIIQDIKLIQDGEIMKMLSDDRAEDFNSWIEVGWVLFNIGEGCDEALDMWIDFSKRSEKFIDGECERHWGGMKLCNKGLASLLYMARTDNPQMFDLWKGQNIDYLIDYSVVKNPKPNECDVSRVVYEMYKNRYVCADSKHNIWFEFHSHRWHTMDASIKLGMKFCKEVTAKYYGYIAKLSDTLARNLTMDESERNLLQSKTKKAFAIIDALKTKSFHDKLLYFCKMEFNNQEFLDRLDMDQNLFCFENGVYDLDKDMFREGRPDDCCSMTCGYNYRTYVKDDPDYDYVKNMFRKIHVDKNIRTYFYDTMSIQFMGGNKYKLFLIHTGDNGDNGKSVTFTLVSKTFGQYFFKFDRNIILANNKSSSSAAKPELIRAHKKRPGVIDELGKHDKYDIAMIKMLTGNDSLPSRDLYHGSSDIKDRESTHTLNVLCNVPPNFPPDDSAFWNRAKYLEYRSQFIKPDKLHEKPVPKTLAEQIKLKRFKADVSLTEKFDDLAPAFAFKLLKHLRKVKLHGLKEPPEVSLATNNSKSANDVLSLFLTDKVVQTSVSTDVILFDTIWVLFEEWHNDMYGKNTKIQFSKINFKVNISKHIGEYSLKHRGWVGSKMVEEDIVTSGVCSNPNDMMGHMKMVQTTKKVVVK
jgi:phage/plasmid-associated DNA primase